MVIIVYARRNLIGINWGRQRFYIRPVIWQLSPKWSLGELYETIISLISKTKSTTYLLLVRQSHKFTIVFHWYTLHWYAIPQSLLNHAKIFQYSLYAMAVRSMQSALLAFRIVLTLRIWIHAQLYRSGLVIIMVGIQPINIPAFSMVSTTSAAWLFRMIAPILMTLSWRIQTGVHKAFAQPVKNL